MRLYGYKDHVRAEDKSKLIDKYTVRDASVHDSQPLNDLLEEEKDQDFHADSAYAGEEQKASNRKTSKVRARVECVFGFMKQSMKGLYLRSVGMLRVKTIIGLINLIYSLINVKS